MFFFFLAGQLFVNFSQWSDTGPYRLQVVSITQTLFHIISCLSANVLDEECSMIDCSNADGCTLNSTDDAVCFCNSGYELQNDGSCIGNLFFFRIMQTNIIVFEPCSVKKGLNTIARVSALVSLHRLCRRTWIKKFC